MQVVADAAEKVPAPQSEQLVDEAVEYVPEAHAPLTAVNAEVAQYFPAAHAIIADWPVVAQKLPATQLMQDD